MRYLRTTLLAFAICCLAPFSLFAQGSDQKEEILDARQEAKDAEKDRKYCEKLGFPASAGDNRCFNTYPSDLATWGKGFSEGLAKVTVNGKAGFIDPSGKMVIKPQFKDVGRFRESIAPFESHSGKWGYIDRNGNEAIPPKFDWAISFSEGLGLVQIGELWGFIDKNGAFVVPATFEEAESFSEGLAEIGYYDKELEWTDTVPRKGRWVRRFIDKKGDVGIPQIFDIIHRGFSEGMAIVSRSLGYSEKHRGSISETYVIDRSGKKLWTLDSWYISHFSDDLLIVGAGKDSEGKDVYSFIDRNGKTVTDRNFSYLTGFSEGLSGARVSWTGKLGFINRNGDFVIEPKFDWVSSFSEGRAAAEDRYKGWGFIDRKGNWSINPQFAWVDEFSEGFALVIPKSNRDKGELTGYVNASGNYIWKPTR